MSTAAMDTDILIVGAGPVGLFLANECARRGLRFRLVEQHATLSAHSKALAVFPRTLEILDMAGLVDPFLEAANRVRNVAIVAHGRPIAHMRFAPDESPYPFIAMVPQDVSERLLAEHLGRCGGVIEYETTLVGALPNGDGVRATLEHAGRREELTAAYVVGCDGAHSTVRHLLKLSFEGGQYDMTYLLADVETNAALPADELELCPSEHGPVALFPMSATRRRVVAEVDHPEGDTPSLAFVRKILEERGPAGVEARALHWSSFFHVHHRQVAQLRVGRMFIAGDAAHIHSPFGGQGMNTGLHDAWNLVWKLDLVLRGFGNGPLLESYNAERRPVIRHVIATTDALAKALGTPSKYAQALRDAVIPMLSHLAPFQHAFVQRLSELGVAYRGSPIVEGAGERYFDDSLRGGDGIKSRFLLVLDEAADLPAQAVAMEFADAFRDVVEFRSGPRKQLLLVRPDGYIAHAARTRDLPGALDHVRALLTRQTNHADVAHHR